MFTLQFKNGEYISIAFSMDGRTTGRRWFKRQTSAGIKWQIDQRQQQTSLLIATVKVQRLFIILLISTLVCIVLITSLDGDCHQTSSVTFSLCFKSPIGSRTGELRNSINQSLLTASTAEQRAPDAPVNLNSKLNVLAATENVEDVIIQRYVTTSPLTGRLGNHLFQLASAYGIAKHNGRKLITLQRFDVNGHFQTKIPEFTPEEKITLPIWPLTEAQVCAFDRNLFNLKDCQDIPVVRLDAYTQSWMYFANAFEEVRRMFTLRSEIVDHVREFFASLIETRSASQNSAKTTFVGIHVRRGDMTTESNRNFGYGTGEADYIERAMLYYLKPKRFHHVTFIVCSDDIAWCEENVKLTKVNASNDSFRIVFASKFNTPIVDLGILASCNHSIITGGTFGWWSAFLAGGEAVYYTGYPRKGSTLEKAFSQSREDFWLPGWVGMD